MKKNSRIFLAGHNGLVGSAVHRKLLKEGFKNILTVRKKKLDLRNFDKTQKYFKKKKIDYMIMAAAKAGGIMANRSNQKDFFFENIEIQNTLLKIALKKKIKRTIFLGTSCIYPKHAKNPIKEDYLLTGKLEKTNQSYAIAKIAGIKLCEVLYNDFNLDIVCLMPTNIYGINDNFNKFSGHVIPAKKNKTQHAKKNKKKKLYLLGTGKAIREFLYCDDLAEAIFLILKKKKKLIYKTCKKKFPIINIGSGKSITINNLSKKISKHLDYRGKIYFDSRYPDGTRKKNLNSSIIRKLGWKPKVSLDIGLKKTIEYFLNYK